MEQSSPQSQPDWQLFLNLGEELLRLPQASEQSGLISQFVSHYLNASSRVYFARPAYPLPGGEDILLLPDAKSPVLVQKAYDNCTLTTSRRKEKAALPLKTQDVLLGVLLVERDADHPFTSTEIQFLHGASTHAALALQITRQINLKNWRFDQLALVRSVNARIANQRNLEELCRQVTVLIRDTFDFYAVSIFTLDPDGKTLHHQASAGPANLDEQRRDKNPIRSGYGIIGQVAKTGREILAPDISTEPQFLYNSVLPDTRAEVALPLKVEGRVLGVLDLQNDESRAIHEFDLSVLRTLADNIAFAIEGATMFAHLGKRASQISAVLDISRAVTSTLEFTTLLEVVVSSIKQHFDYEIVHIYSVNPGRRKINFEAGTGLGGREVEGNQIIFDLDDPNGMIPWVAREGKTRLANDVSRESLYRPAILRPESTKAELAIPLEYAGEILGVLDLQSEKKNGFDVEDLPLLEAMAASIAIAVRNARLYQSEIWRRQVADSFREIAGLVSANVALDDLLNRILDQLDRILPCKAAAIWLLDNGSQAAESSDYNLRLAATRGVEGDQLLTIMDQDDSIRRLVSAILDLDEPFIRSSSSPYGPLGTAMNYGPNYSSIAAPLRAGDEPLGVLILAHPDPGCYGEEAGLISMIFANNAAVSIQNTRLYTSAQEQAWISTILFKVAEAAQNSLSTDELLETMARLTPLLIGVKKCAFFLWDDPLSALFLKSHYGLETEGIDEIVFRQDIPVIQRLISTRQPVFLENPAAELQLDGISMPESNSTVVFLPLVSRGKILGAFLVGHHSENPGSAYSTFDEQTLALLQGIAQQTAVAIENLQLLEGRQEEAYVTAVLLQVSQTVVSQNTLDDILDSIVHLMPILVGIDSCAIYLWHNEDQAFRAEKVFSGSTPLDDALEGLRYSSGQFPLLDTVRERDELMACRVEGSEMSMTDWPSLNHFLPGDELNEQYQPNSNWILGVPLSVKGQVFGVMLAAEANVPPSFHERRQEILSGIAQQVALAIQNDHLTREMVEQERLEQEISLARQIQRTFLPSRLPKTPGWDLSVDWQTAREVGGDFYDIIKLGKLKLGIVIADVSDKGMPAALYMTVTRTLIRAFAWETNSPARVLERVNRLLVVDSQDGLFVTAVYMVLNLAEGTLTYANAGHNLPLLIHAGTREVEPLPKGGMALGVQSSSKLQEHTLEVCPGDQLVLYTDGVSECFSPDGEIFGETHLVQALSAAPADSAGDVIAHLNGVLVEFRQGAPPSDDLTLVVVHRLDTDE